MTSPAPELMTSFILVLRSGDSVSYWGYGQGGKFVEKLQDARRYARRESAFNALWRINKKRALEGLNVEEIVD